MRHRNQEMTVSTLFKGDAGCCIDTRLERAVVAVVVVGEVAGLTR